MTPPVAPIEGAVSREDVERMAQNLDAEAAALDGITKAFGDASPERRAKAALAQVKAAALRDVLAQLAAAQLAAQGAREAGREQGIREAAAEAIKWKAPDDIRAFVPTGGGPLSDDAVSAAQVMLHYAEQDILALLTPVESSPDTSAGEMT